MDENEMIRSSDETSKLCLWLSKIDKEVSGV